MVTVMLRDVSRLDAFARDVVDGWIMLIRSNAHGDVMVASYTMMTQFDGHWVEDTTLLSRGLVLRFPSVKHVDELNAAVKNKNTALVASLLGDARVIARGMPKFFTVEASTSDWGHVELRDDDENVTVDSDYTIDYDAPAIVSDKLSGALGIGVIVDGDILLSTKGSCNSEEAVIGTRLLHEKHDADKYRDLLVGEYDGFTPLFEIITTEAEFEHVINYGDMNDIVFLGLIHNSDGHWVPAGLLDTDPLTAGKPNGELTHGFTTPEVYSAGTLGEALTMTQPSNHEGVVITLLTERGNGKQDMFKLKYDEYYRLRAVRDMINNKRATRDLVKQLTVDEIMSLDRASIHARIMGMVRSTDARTIAHAETMANRVVDALINGVITTIRDTTLSVINDYERLAGEVTTDITTVDGAREYARLVAQQDKTRRTLLFAARSSLIDNGTPVEGVVMLARKQALKAL